MALLVEAFENSDPECTYYLDLETGEVAAATGEMSSAAEELTELAEEEGIELEQAVAASNLPDWMKEPVIVAARMEQRLGVSAIGIPEDESRDAYRDMSDFAETVTNPALRGRLQQALDGARPFRRFKDAVSSNPAAEERWYAFCDERLRQRILVWLAEEDIELIQD